MTKLHAPWFFCIFLVLAVAGCKRGHDTATEAPLVRSAFNRTAAMLDLPLFWVADADDSGTVDAAEVAVLWGVDDSERSDFIDGDHLTARGQRAVAEITSVLREGEAPVGTGPQGRARHAAVVAELAQGQPTLLQRDFSAAATEDRALVSHILAAAHLIEEIFAQQKGVADMAAQIPPEDRAARMLFYRNQGPWCTAPKTERDPQCTALAKRPPRRSGLYPAALQQSDDFCQTLATRPDHERLLSPFVVVDEDPSGALRAVPYSEAYPEEMAGISKHLKAAAAAVTDPGEAALARYLKAAAQAFLDNNWLPADEAWAKMNTTNSKWYLRIGPDETYFEPCNRKAGFHVSFATVNQGSLKWQRRLEPHKAAMEMAIAAVAGPPYKARNVSFHLPDFIDIVLNAGDSRSPHGATIGQSLPNWGPVANEGRGRTVAMTNLYTDPDSKATFRQQATAVLCKDALRYYDDDTEPLLMSTVLHEAAHNLGPAHEYEVGGKTDEEIFGGPLASMMEELKAQTAALYLADWLVDQEVIDAKLATRAHARDVAWGFGHIARGMYTAEHHPRPYSQLASIQLGFLRQHGGLTWNAEALAANGSDRGCISLSPDHIRTAAKELMRQVAGIKARGDADAARSLVAEFVDAGDDWATLRGVITERWLRLPKASFVYAVRL